jgi:hypothetical protein
MWTTGLDDNGDGLINDRPPGVGLWALRGTPQSTLSTRWAYTLTPGAPPGTPNQNVRYRLIMFVQVNNLTNHPNYSGFSGARSSRFFMQPRSVNNPRRIDVGLNATF